jgi:uncharacterized protein (UPF0332 family)
MEIDKELERSYKSLKSAELLFQEKLYEDCISRCYYSILVMIWYSRDWKMQENS